MLYYMDGHCKISNVIDIKALLLLILDNTNNITLCDVNSILTYDIMSYMKFRIMNDEILKNTNVRVLENLIQASILGNTPTAFTQKLMQNLPATSLYTSNEYMCHNSYSHRWKKPNKFISLFEEDI